MIEKPKAKNSSISKWLSPLVSPLSIELEAPYPLETCVILLERQPETRFWQRHKDHIQLVPVDEDTYHLKAGLSQQRSEVVAEGFLKRWQFDTTYITARINVAFSEYLIVGFTLFLWTLFSLSRLDYFWFIGLGIVALNLYKLRRRRNALKRVIETALEINSA